MKLARRLIVSLIAALLVVAPLAQAQQYPINNPTYIPTAVLAASTFTAAGTATFNNNGNGTALIRVAGTNTGLSAVVQITESRAASPTWTTVPVQTVGGSRISTITANGLYRLNINGATQVRFNLASITGTNVIVSASATPGAEFVQQLPAVKTTYSATATVAPAASGTDLLTITGSATKTVSVTHASCSGTSTAVGAGSLFLAKRSTANTGGTSAAVTAVPVDSADAAASATVLNYSANPTTGTLVGNVASAIITLTPAATTTYGALPVKWDFGQRDGEKPIVLRGIAQVFALNGGGVTLPSGASLLCNLAWTEE